MNFILASNGAHAAQPMVANTLGTFRWCSENIFGSETKSEFHGGIVMY